MTFEEAYRRLEQIHATLQSQELIDIEKLIALQKEAKHCFDICEKGLIQKAGD